MSGANDKPENRTLFSVLGFMTAANIALVGLLYSGMSSRISALEAAIERMSERVYQLRKEVREK